MSRRVLSWAVMFALSFVAAPTRGDEEKERVGKLQKKLFEKESTKIKIDYLLYLPNGYGKEEKTWPVVLFLHGKGDSIGRLERAGLPKQVERKKDHPFILVAPEAPGGRFWNPRDLNALLDEVEAKYKVDKDRVYVTGLSMGGFGTWSLAAASPERFAALVPICGGGNPSSAKKLKNMPIWVFHGAKDTTVPAKRSEAMVEALKEAGAEGVKFTLYPDAGHDAWTPTYKNPEVWEWLLKQKRPAKKE